MSNLRPFADQLPSIQGPNKEQFETRIKVTYCYNQQALQTLTDNHKARACEHVCCVQWWQTMCCLAFSNIVQQKSMHIKAMTQLWETNADSEQRIYKNSVKKMSVSFPAQQCFSWSTLNDPCQFILYLFFKRFKGLEPPPTNSQSFQNFKEKLSSYQKASTDMTLIFPYLSTKW